MDQQTQTQQTSHDPARVQWGPDKRTGKILNTITLDGEDWSVVDSDEWVERKDLRHAAADRFYQRKGSTPDPRCAPCLLIIRSRDLAPASPAAPAKPATAGLKEDLAQALAGIVALRQTLTSEGARSLAATVERAILGAQAAVGEG